MIRTLFNSPPQVEWRFLEQQLKEVCPDLIAINDVDGSVAVYTPGTLSASVTVDVETVLSLHTGEAPFEPLDAAGALATLLVVLNVVPLVDAANAIHEEPAHLIAEAEAWSLGTPPV